MKISVPKRWLDWLNEPIYHWRRYTFVRVDVAIVFFGILCVGWYAYTDGLKGALIGAVGYTIMAFAAMFLF